MKQILTAWVEQTKQQGAHYINTIILLVIAALAWNHFKPSPAPVGMPVVAKAAPQLANMPTEDITPAKMHAFKSPAKKKLSLPAAVQVDRHQHVLASARISPDTHPQTVTPVFDDITGQTKMYVTREPFPWFATINTGSIGIYTGYTNGFDRVTWVEAHKDFVQVKGWNFGLSGMFATTKNWYGGVGAIYRW